MLVFFILFYRQFSKIWLDFSPSIESISKLISLQINIYLFFILFAVFNILFIIKLLAYLKAEKQYKITANSIEFMSEENKQGKSEAKENNCSALLEEKEKRIQELKEMIAILKEKK